MSLLPKGIPCGVKSCFWFIIKWHTHTNVYMTINPSISQVVVLFVKAHHTHTRPPRPRQDSLSPLSLIYATSHAKVFPVPWTICLRLMFTSRSVPPNVCCFTAASPVQTHNRATRCDTRYAVMYHFTTTFPRPVRDWEKKEKRERERTMNDGKISPRA